jgi:hypothetical protein
MASIADEKFTVWCRAPLMPIRAASDPPTTPATCYHMLQKVLLDHQDSLSCDVLGFHQCERHSYTPCRESTRYAAVGKLNMTEAEPLYDRCVVLQPWATKGNTVPCLVSGSPRIVIVGCDGISPVHSPV